jgi:hypothetical protein
MSENSTFLPSLTASTDVFPAAIAKDEGWSAYNSGLGLEVY